MATSATGRRMVVGESSSWRCKGEKPIWMQWRKAEVAVELGLEGDRRKRERGRRK